MKDYYLCNVLRSIKLPTSVFVVEQFRFPRFNEVAEAVKAFEGRRSALEMLDAFRYPKVKSY